MISTLSPELYPYKTIIIGLIVILTILYYVCYRYTDVTNILMIAFTAMIFLHLDLLTYDMTFSWFEGYMDFFVLEKISPAILILVEATGLMVLSLVPFLVWFIPMVMMDEKLTGYMCSKASLIRLKSGILLVFGLVMNAIFVFEILKSQGIDIFNL